MVLPAVQFRLFQQRGYLLRLPAFVNFKRRSYRSTPSGCTATVYLAEAGVCRFSFLADGKVCGGQTVFFEY